MGQQQGYPQAQGYQGDPRVARGYPAQGTGQQRQQQQEVPDFLMLAARQLGRIENELEKAAAAQGQPGGLTGDQVRDIRFKLAEGYTALADIQYSVPDDGEDDGGEGEGDLTDYR